MSDRVLRVRDVARALGVQAKTIRRYILAGKLRATRLPSGHWRIREADLRAVLDEPRTVE